MAEKNLFHLWKETISSKPGPRDSFKGMHLGALHQATQRKLGEQLLLIQFEIHDFVLCELKGRPTDMTGFELPGREGGILWLCLQFHGKLSFPGGHVSQPDSVFSLASTGEDHKLTLPAEKQWVLLLGVSGASRQQLLSELPRLRSEYDRQQGSNTADFPITFTDRQVLETFSWLRFGPFTTQYHIGQLLAKLYAAYTQQLDKRVEAGGERSLILLYHQAIAYITANYMDEGLNRDKVASACNCSVRKLSRAFEGRSVTPGSAILVIRLHKGRELLHKNKELSVERIAVMLHFPNGKHFATQYKKYFHRSPREERKEIAERR